MEKYILRTDDDKANDLIHSIENNVIPVIKSLADELTRLGIDSDPKQRIAELFRGNYAVIEAEYRARLEKDAALFQSPSAKEGIVSQFGEVMADFKEFVGENCKRISYREVNELQLIDPVVLNYLEFKKGVPVITKENKDAIFERYTTYVHTEKASEFHKKHQEAVAALNNLSQLCKEVGIGFYHPLNLYTTFFKQGDNEEIKAKDIDYDAILRRNEPEVEEPESEPEEVVVKPKEPSFKEVTPSSHKSKPIYAEKYREKNSEI